MTEQPMPWLGDIRVLELSRRVTGAYCGRLLAMLGADIIKLESPGYLDGSRAAGPFLQGSSDGDASGAYRYLHAQKRSLSVDLSTSAGSEILHRLAGQVDAVIDDGALGYPPDVNEVYAELRRLNPRLVICALFPNGLDGPRAHHQGTEITELATSGWLFAPAPGGPDAVMPGAPAAHYAMGSMAASGIMLALIARRTTGAGQIVEVPANETAILFPPFLTMVASVSGIDMPRLGDNFPYAVFECADGHIGISILTQRHWDGLMELMGHPEAFNEPRFQSGVTRMQPDVAREITAIIAEWAKTQRAEETFHRGQALRVAVAIIPSPSEVLRSPQYEARKFWEEYEDEHLGRLRIPGQPFRPATGGFAPFRPAPSLGADNDSVLGEVVAS